MDNKLSHLTPDEIDELIKRYYKNEKITELKRDFNFTLSSNQLVKYFPPEVTEINCKYCHTNFTKLRIQREYSSYNKSVAACPACGHVENANCSCFNCLMEELRRKEKIRSEKKEKLNQFLHGRLETSIDIENLSFVQKIYLGAFLREGLSEDFSYIKSVEDFINPLAPTREFQIEILSTLIDDQIIIIHSDTDPDYYWINYFEEVDRITYNRDQVKWLLNVKKNGLSRIELIESLISPLDLKEKDYENAFQLWKRIALYESLEYFKYHVYNVFSVDYKIGTKTISVINDLLNDFSVSQIYGIIYYSINRALRFQAENDHIFKSHAANTIIGYAQSYGERALANKYNMRKYNRIKECPESALSKFFFERVLKISYDGFNEKPFLKFKQENL